MRNRRKDMLARMIAFFMIAILTVVPAATTSAASTDVFLSGYVHLLGGDGDVSKAVITLTDTQTLEDIQISPNADGFYQFTREQFAEGPKNYENYQITAELEGYTNRSAAGITASSKDFDLVPGNGSEIFQISGRIIDEDGSGATGVDMFINNEISPRAVSSEGDFAMDMWQGATVTVTPVMEGYYFTPASYTLTDLDKNETIHFIRHPGEAPVEREFQFQVRDIKTSQPVADANVTVTPKTGGEVVAETKTDDRGIAHITVLPGDYSIRFTALGYQSGVYVKQLTETSQPFLINLNPKQDEPIVFWDGKRDIKAGETYYLKKNVAVYQDVRIEKGGKLLLASDAVITVVAVTGSLTVNGTIENAEEERGFLRVAGGSITGTSQSLRNYSYPITVSSGTCDKTRAFWGEIITVNSDPAQEGYAFESWNAAGVQDLSEDALKNPVLTFSMPRNAVELSAVYAASAVVEGVSLDKEELTIKVNDKQQLTATITPSDAVNQEVVWESDNPEVAKVDENGLITAISPGSCTITVTTVEGEKRASCSVIVEDEKEEELPPSGGDGNGEQPPKPNPDNQDGGNDNNNNGNNNKPKPSDNPDNNSIKNQWTATDDGWKYVDENGKYVSKGWKLLGGKWYYFDENGNMVTGWLNLGGTWYYLSQDGALQTNTWIGGSYVDAGGIWVPGKDVQNGAWILDNTSWWYQLSDGSYLANTWMEIDGSWYYFKGDGYIHTGWLDDNGIWYYLNPDGRMAFGWLNENEDWYYLYGNGAMAVDAWIGNCYVDAHGRWMPQRDIQKGAWVNDNVGWWYRLSDGAWLSNMWKEIGQTWYYFKGDGYLHTGWLLLEEGWYYLDQEGRMLTGWQYIDNSWYYLNNSGLMMTGWYNDGRYWYYLNSDGSMHTGRFEENGEFYYFNENGTLRKPV